MEEKTSKERIAEYFQSFETPGIIFIDEKISCPEGDFLTFGKKFTNVDFFSYDKEKNKYEKRNNRPTLIVHNDVDLFEVLDTRSSSYYDIRWFDYLRAILGIDEDYIKITKTGSRIIRRKSDKLIVIPKIILDEIYSDSLSVFKQGKSSRARLVTYLLNKLKLKYTKKAPKETTTVGIGDFSFMVERFNLKNKHTKKDYEKFLNKEDVKNLEFFTDKLIKDSVFSSDFLRTLDEYIIKEKLKDIILLGRGILELGNGDMKTNKAKKIIAKITDDPTGIKQLENLWQKYFEKYLLYLIFSYKKIYPKIEFKNINGEKKYPDFIGINHYNGLDIIEIKTHLKNAVTWDASHKNFSFSSELSKAVIQTMNYMDAIVQRRFNDTSDEKKITNTTEEENLYHPRGIIIISSDRWLTKGKLSKSKDESLRRDFTKLRNSLQNIEILTFSEILQIADDYVKNIHSQYE